MFLLSLPQSHARRTAIEPRIRMHASNLTLVQPYDGRRPRLQAAEVAALACFMLLPKMTEENSVGARWHCLGGQHSADDRHGC